MTWNRRLSSEKGAEWPPWVRTRSYEAALRSKQVGDTGYPVSSLHPRLHLSCGPHVNESSVLKWHQIVLLKRWRLHTPVNTNCPKLADLSPCVFATSDGRETSKASNEKGLLGEVGVKKATRWGAPFTQRPRSSRIPINFVEADLIPIGQRLLIRSQWDMGSGYFPFGSAPPGPLTSEYLDGYCLWNSRYFWAPRLSH